MGGSLATSGFPIIDGLRETHSKKRPGGCAAAVWWLCGGSGERVGAARGLRGGCGSGAELWWRRGWQRRGAVVGGSVWGRGGAWGLRWLRGDSGGGVVAAAQRVGAAFGIKNY